MEDYAYVLDYLTQGRATDSKFRREPVAYALGAAEFKLFELVPKPGAQMTVGQRVYIGREMDQKTEIMGVKRRISYNELTSAAQKELPFVIEQAVKDQEQRFVDFYNKAEAITTKFHMLELLPGLGKKTMWALVEEKKRGAFKSFEDMEKRIPVLRQPIHLIAQRILKELENPGEKYRLFVAR
jgi:putative nucleotide binding protein